MAAEGSHDPSKPLEKYKKQELVAFLKVRGLSSSGNKDQFGGHLSVATEKDTCTSVDRKNNQLISYPCHMYWC